uniref:protein EXECUTER 1, chloroplastic-like n=1 Tax=Erigeron canadensis TaxID=72917 RepID=UPI001CB94750|nr:protein EXECUTER 1, chloroplastic-like [Erigeron canadensis]
MTSIIPTPAFTSYTNSPRHKFVTIKTNRLNHKPSSPILFPFSISNSKVSTSSLICSCNINNNDNNEEVKGYKKYVKNAIKWFNNYMTGDKKIHMNNDDKNKDDVIKDSGDVTVDSEWDWERWKKHFVQVDQQERLLSVLKSHLKRAISKEDYEDAARIKVAIAAAANNDTVGRVMSHLRKAIEEERYMDAAFVRDYAGAALVGWWAGLSDDNKDPYGRIIRVSAEHGRYLARSYSPRQLATASDGAPLFEVFLTMNDNGEYKYQAVYLKRPEVPQDLPAVSSKSSPLISSTKLPEIVVKDIEDKDNDYEMDDDDDGDDDDDDMAEESAFENILRDMIPGAKELKVEVLNVTKPEKIDRNLINKVVEEIADEEDEKEKDTDSEDLDGTNVEQDDIDVDSDSSVVDSEGKSQIAVKIIVGGLVQKVSNGTTRKQLIRVPAKLEKRSRSSFTFSIENEKQLVSSRNAQSIKKKDTRIRGNRSTESVMFDLAKSIGKGKIPMKVLKDVGHMINLTLNQAKNRQPLSGSTTFNRIDLPKTSDPLNGLYVGAHGLYTSEVIHLKRKFGQWQEDGGMKEPSALEFYEYVEAVKLTGDPYVPAGQVAFRAKVGTQYQLPHKGIIPEEFGVIARYRGQGRLAEPGFENPRWVDGELVVLDGKYIKAGPVVGFVYWAPEYQFLVFFNQLRLQN